MQALPGLTKPLAGLGEDVYKGIPEFSVLYKATSKPRPLPKLPSQMQSAMEQCPCLAWSAMQTSSVRGREQEVTALEPTSFRHSL